MGLENLDLSEYEKRYFKVLVGELPMKYLYCMVKKAVQELKNEWENNQIEKAPLLSIQELADKFNVTKATIHNWIKRRIITGKKMGKGRFFDEKEVREALDKFKGYGPQ